MKLKEFVDKYIEHNTMVRLWTKMSNGNLCMVEDNVNKVFMNHVIKNTYYKNWIFISVTNVLCRGGYPEATNLIVVDPNPYSAFINNLRSDEEMQRAYKDNIAMAFKDNYNVNRTLHENANYCARKFIEQLIK